jgi:hypothetical protein
LRAFPLVSIRGGKGRQRGMEEEGMKKGAKSNQGKFPRNGSSPFSGPKNIGRIKTAWKRKQSECVEFHLMGSYAVWFL